MIFKKGCVFMLFFLQLNILLAQQPILKIPTAHTAWILNFAVSNNGKYIATCSVDFTIKLWDYRTKKELRVFKGHKGSVNTIAFSPDDSLLLSGSNDANIKIWNVKTGECIRTIDSMFNRKVNDVSFSSDGKLIAGCSDNGISVMNLETNRIIGRFTLSSRGLKVKFFPDIKKLATIEADSSFSIWSVKDTLAYVVDESFSYKHGNINDFFISKDGKLVFSAVNTTITNIRMHAFQRTATASFDSIRFQGHANPAKGISAGETDDVFYSMSTRDNPTHFIPEIEIKKWSIPLQKCIDSFYIEDNVSSSVNNGLLISLEKELVLNNFNTVYFLPVTNTEVRTKIASRTTITNGMSDNDSLITLTAEDGVIRFFNRKNNSLTIHNTNSLISFSRFSQPDNALFAQKNIIGKNYSSNILKYNKFNNHTDTLVQEEGYIAYDPGLAISDDRSLIGYKVIPVQNGKFINDSARFKIWNLNKDSIIRNSQASLIADVKFLPDNRSFVLCTNVSNSLFLYRDTIETVFKDTILGKHDYYSQLEILDSNRVICSDNKGVTIWNMAENKIEKKISVFENRGVYINPVYIKLSTDKEKLLLGQNDTVRLVNIASGELLQTFTADMGWVYNMEFAHAANTIFTTSIDNSVRFWDTRTGKEKYKIIFIDSTDWIIISPEGYYQCTPAAAKLLHYVTKDYKIITFEQLDTKYNRPDKILETMDNVDSVLIKSYRQAWEKRIRKLGIDTTSFREGYSVPEADFSKRDNIAYEQKNENLILTIKAVDSTYNLDRFNIWVNETPVFGQRGGNLRKKNINNLDTTITIKLSQGENRIETSISNVNGTESYRMPLLVNFTPSSKQKEKTRFIGIGIDRFKDSLYNLTYSSKDIRDLAKKLKQKYGNDITIDTLFNEQVTVKNIKTLKRKLLQTSVNDKVIVAYSGHGLLSKDYDYYLSTYSVNFNKPEENGLPYDELENLLDSIPARKKLMLIDACHSGEVDKEEGIAMNRMADSLGLFKPKGIILDETQSQHLGLKNSFELMQSLFVNVGKSTGATIISAAAGNQFALERGDLKNGVFTYSILEAMRNFDSMKISELKKIVGARVEQLTNGMQKPTSRNEAIAVDWILWEK